MTNPHRSRAAKNGWATRRLNKHIRDVEQHTGKRPESVTVFAEGFMYLKMNHPEGIDIRCGTRKPT